MPTTSSWSGAASARAVAECATAERRERPMLRDAERWGEAGREGERWGEVGRDGDIWREMERDGGKAREACEVNTPT